MKEDDQEAQAALLSKIEAMNVSSSWRDTFLRLAQGKRLVWPSVWGVFFGAFYYLAMGMWRRLVIYLPIYVLIMAVEYVVESRANGGIYWLPWLNIVLGFGWGILAPYDYYRYKVLGRKW